MIEPLEIMSMKTEPYADAAGYKVVLNGEKIRFSRWETKDEMYEFVRARIPEVAKGYCRVSMTIDVSIFDNEVRWATKDIELYKGVDS